MITSTNTDTIIPSNTSSEKISQEDFKSEKPSQAVFSFSPNDESDSSQPHEVNIPSEPKTQETEKSSEKPKFFNKKQDFYKHRHQHHKHPQQHQKQNQPQHQHPHQKQPQQPSSKSPQQPQPQKTKTKVAQVDLGGLVLGHLPQYDLFKNKEALSALATELSTNETPINFNELYELPLQDLAHKVVEFGMQHDHIPHRRTLLLQILNWAKEQRRPIIIKGLFEKLDNGGVVVYKNYNYAIKDFSAFIPESMIKEYGLLRGHEVEIQAHPPREGETCPFALKILKIMDTDPEEVVKRIPFEDLIPYYPTTRLFLETKPDVTWDNISMRVVDILSPIGLGQRGLIVAPPRTGKTMLLQGIAHAIAMNQPNAHLIVLLIDERPEEVTDFKRQVTSGEVISSTFDESAISHVHAAEMVIEKARRLVECGKDVVILLDSITRLARAYNTLMPSSGKILSGGVEANSLQKPKRFFGSARNIEDGGSLTILGTALIDTGSRMDEVIFEEFKGTGNMEIHLDRELVAKRVFPAISMDRSGTRKEELIYHPDEMEKIYVLRKAMKGVPPVEAVELLIQRIRKTKNNTEFLLGLTR
ncbi:MAG: transcription termination factor Rho [Verrucomicrobia bacterium]|nr:MAG: transcription termination factor Rho [Verrucomicrobiota bacterium]